MILSTHHRARVSHTHTLYIYIGMGEKQTNELIHPCKKQTQETALTTQFDYLISMTRLWNDTRKDLRLIGRGVAMR